MNAREPVDLMKMAIGVLLLCLLLGATVAFFYFAYDNTDARVHSMQKAVNSSSMERLYELQDKSWQNPNDISSQPLVTSVVNTLQEFSEDSLLYVGVYPPNADPVFFTYTGTNLQQNDVRISDTPVLDASKFLLQYSDCRTAVLLTEVDASTGAELNNQYSGHGFMAVKLTLYNDPLAGG